MADNNDEIARFSGRLVEAILDYNINLIEILIEDGLDLNESCSDNNEKPLHCAVLYGSFEAVELLILNGADPNVKDNEGRSPLHLAIGENEFTKVKILVDNHATPIDFSHLSDIDREALEHIEDNGDIDNYLRFYDTLDIKTPEDF